MTCHGRWFGWPALLLVSLSACQPLGRQPGPVSVEPVAKVEPVVASSPAVSWSAANDCRGMLPPLKRGLDAGLITGLEGTPFIMIGQDSTVGLSGLSSSGRRIVSGPEISPGDVDARCVLRVGQALDHRSDHRVLGRERVRSRYQSGTRSEKNPAYEVAKARLRRAEKAAKPGKSSIMKVGDPLLDLVGLLVGGALTGFGQWDAGDQVEEALETLMATPPSIDHPKYESYHFERTRIRASRAATIPVILTDRRIGRSWEASLKRRELRELFVVTGLDRQDEAFARHSQDSLTEGGLQRWLTESPSLSIVDVAAGLLDRSATIPIDRVAFAKPEIETSDDEPLPGDAVLDAAALPPPQRLGIEGHGLGRPSSGMGEESSRIEIVGETASAGGVFIAPHFILTPSEVVGEQGLVDVEDAPGHVALGLVAAVDHGLGLALVQSPLTGHPVAIGNGVASAGQGRQALQASSGTVVGEPLLSDGKLVGFSAAAGPNIESTAIRMFLDRQRHLLPKAR